MSAQQVKVFAIEYPEPDSEGKIPSNSAEELSANVSYRFSLSDNIRTLTTNNALTGTGASGPLYVPDLTSDSCKTAESKVIPANATRISDIEGDWSYVGLVPWLSPECVLEYLSAAQAADTLALLVYLNNNETDTPPTVNQPDWSLGDGGRWKSETDYPVYAIPGKYGADLMTQLSLYSGNITEVPYGDEIASHYSPNASVKLCASIDTGTSSTLPSLWVFLVIVLGVLLAVIALTSLLIHLVQRRRRQQLRERIANGDVPLRTIGLHKLTVPQDILNKIPIITYQEVSESEADRPADAPHDFSQPTCAICLDDFVAGETQVRQLPCRHIFHPTCVDPYLLGTSAFCPTCKQSTLPKGYCPAVITNSMVRRERTARFIAERRAAGELGHGNPTLDEWRRDGLMYRFAIWVARPPQRRRPNRPTPSHATDIEMTADAPPPPATAPPTAVTEVSAVTGPTAGSSDPACPPAGARHRDPAWIQHRLRNVFKRSHGGQDHGATSDGSDQDPAALAEEEERARPRWKKIIRAVWPWP